MNAIGKYFKIYPLKVLRTFPNWKDTEQMSDETRLYLQDNYLVTKGIFKDWQIIFEDVTPEWVIFCHDHLDFKPPTFAQNALVIEKGIVGERMPLLSRDDFDTEEAKPWWQMFEAAYEVPHELDASQIKQVVRSLVTQYDGLRLRIVKDETGYHKFIAMVDPNVFVEQDISSLPNDKQEQILREIIDTQWASLDFAKGPLLRIVYLNCGPTRPAVLLIIIHHVLMDGYSLGIFLKDFEDACRQLTQGEAVNILPATTRFKTWAERMDAYCRSDTGKKDFDLWWSLPWERLQHLPVDYPENLVIGQPTPSGAITGSYLYTKEISVWGNLTVEETEALLKVPHIYQVSMMDVLLTALSLTFYRWQKVNPIYIITNDNNRHLFDDLNLTRMIGYLNSACPILLELPTENMSDHREALSSIKEQFAQIPHHGNGWDWFQMFYRDIVDARLPNLADIFFIYYGHTSDVKVLGYSSLFRRIRLPDRAPLVEPIQTELKKDQPFAFAGFCEISDGKFQIRWMYKEGLHTQSTAETIVQTYLDVLKSFSQGKM